MANSGRFSQISEELAIGITDLSDNAKWMFVLLLLGRTRKKWTGEPHKKEFELSYLDFKIYGLSRKKYNKNIKELRLKKYIRVSGRQRTQICEVLKW